MLRTSQLLAWCAAGVGAAACRRGAARVGLREAEERSEVEVDLLSTSTLTGGTNYTLTTDGRARFRRRPPPVRAPMRPPGGGAACTCAPSRGSSTRRCVSALCFSRVFHALLQYGPLLTLVVPALAEAERKHQPGERRFSFSLRTAGC